jgi:hypothetical protein
MANRGKRWTSTTKFPTVTTASYFVRAGATAISTPLIMMCCLDDTFKFNGSWQPPSSISSFPTILPATWMHPDIQVNFNKSVCQIIKQGGYYGLTGAALVFPAALYAATCAFTKWLHEESHLPQRGLPVDWLSDHATRH